MERIMPIQARYCVKWKASEGKLVLKLTDDTTVRAVLFCQSLSYLTLSYLVFEVQDLLLRLPESLRCFEQVTHAKDAKCAARFPKIRSQVGSWIGGSLEGRCAVRDASAHPNFCFESCRRSEEEEREEEKVVGNPL